MRYYLLFILPALAVAVDIDDTVYKAEKRLLYKRSLNLDNPDVEVPEEINDPTKIEWITQKLDHFDARNANKWMMRYISNTKNFKAQSPIFIYVGGEWTVSADPITSGHFYNIGKELNAAFYYTEHRFYGQSRPTNDLTVGSLKFLSVRQALADLAHFIRTVKLQPNMRNSKVIIASGSYGGNMVTWFKKLYPDLIVGAWSSCAPLLAKLDFFEYNQVLGRSVNSVCGANVYNRIKNGLRNLENLYDTNILAFRTKLNICSDFDNTDVYNMYEVFKTIANIFAGNLQSASYYSIKSDVCEVFANYWGKDEDAVANYFKSAIGTNNCISLNFRGRVNYYKVTDWNYWAKSFVNDRAWTWQTCSEYGYHQSSSPNQPFGNRFPVQYFLKQCNDIFGLNSTAVTANVAATNALFGGVNPQVKNVFWSHGSLDPWHPLGIHTNNGKNNIISWYSHMEDNGSIDPQSDSNDMMDLKRDVRTAIRSWLGYKN